MDVIIAKLSKANGLQNIIDSAKFSDETKPGKGKEKDDKSKHLIWRKPV